MEYVFELTHSFKLDYLIKDLYLSMEDALLSSQVSQGFHNIQTEIMNKKCEPAVFTQ